MTYYRINQDEAKPTFEPVEIPEGDTEWLRACYDLIGCNQIEVATTHFKGLLLLVDEEGKLWDGWQSRINYVATLLHGGWRDPIVGDAILCREKDGDLIPPTDKDIDTLIRLFPDGQRPM